MKSNCLILGALFLVIVAGEECPSDISAQCPAVDPSTPVYFEYPNDCSKFCQCSSGTAYVEPCPPGLDFDTSLDVCNDPALVR